MMNLRIMVSSGSRLLKRTSTTVVDAPFSAGVEKRMAAIAVSPTMADDASRLRKKKTYKNLSGLIETGGTVTEALNEFIKEGKYQQAFEIYEWMER